MFHLSHRKYLESIESNFKAYIYYIIPYNTFILFLREAEWLVKNRDKSLNQKIKEFFENCNLIYDMPSEIFISGYYLNEIEN